MISISKKCFSLNIDILIHNLTSEKYAPLDILNINMFYFGSPGYDCTKDKKQPKKSAAFGGRLLVLFWGLKYIQFLEVQNKINTYWVYLMEHIFLRSNYVLKYWFFINIVNFRISCQIAIRRPVFLNWKWKWGIPERDIWSLHVMDQGSCQIGRVLGTPSPWSPPSFFWKIWKF